MANSAGHFQDSPVFIYDKNSNFITRTIITGHSADKRYVEVSEGLMNIRPGTRLQLLIFHSTGASELSGTLKNIRKGIYRISVYGERQRDVRTSVRHRINASAVISDMITDSEPEAFHKPIEVTIEDLSTTGLLLRSRTVRFEMESLLQIEFKLHGKDVILFGEVVREQAHNNNVYKYGCKLYFRD